MGGKRLRKSSSQAGDQDQDDLLDPEDRRMAYAAADQEMHMYAGGDDINQDHSVAGGKRGGARRGEHHMYTMNSEMPLNTSTADILGGEGKFLTHKHSSRRSFHSISH